MLKCNKGGRTVELEEALATVLDIIKSVNDSMHQIAITGFEVSKLAETSFTSSFLLSEREKKKVGVFLIACGFLFPEML